MLLRPSAGRRNGFIPELADRAALRASRFFRIYPREDGFQRASAPCAKGFAPEEERWLDSCRRPVGRVSGAFYPRFLGDLRLCQSRDLGRTTLLSITSNASNSDTLDQVVAQPWAPAPTSPAQAATQRRYACNSRWFWRGAVLVQTLRGFTKPYPQRRRRHNAMTRPAWRLTAEAQHTAGRSDSGCAHIASTGNGAPACLDFGSKHNRQAWYLASTAGSAYRRRRSGRRMKFQPR